MTEHRSYLHSSSFKMAMLFTLLLGLTVGILGYFSYFFSRDYYINDIQTAIDTNIQNLLVWDEEDQLANMLDRLTPSPQSAYLLIDADSQKIAGTLEALPKKAARISEGVVSFRHNNLLYAAKIHTFPDNRKLLVGVNIDDMSRHYERMKWLSWLSIALMVFVILVSFLISTFVVSRTSRIANTAANIIATGDLSQRLKIDSKWDDLSYMAGVLNEFLDRNQKLVQGIQQVSNNIAHDLRTPLTRLRNHLENLQDTTEVKASPDLAVTCQNLIEETDQILRTFASLLRIARIEAGQERHLFVRFSLADLIQDVIELYEPVADNKKIALSGKIDNLSYTGDRDLIFQAFANLIDNALKYTPDGGKVLIEAGEANGMIIATITDDGPGIPSPDMPRVFERFYRAEASRNSPGSGLGLSLVAAVIDLHRGRIQLKNMSPGLAVTVTLPTNLTKI
jgi:signal transduction histidine kinase